MADPQIDAIAAAIRADVRLLQAGAPMVPAVLPVPPLSDLYGGIDLAGAGVDVVNGTVAGLRGAVSARITQVYGLSPIERALPAVAQSVAQAKAQEELFARQADFAQLTADLDRLKQERRQRVQAAPDLCLTCGASFACEHGFTGLPLVERAGRSFLRPVPDLTPRQAIRQRRLGLAVTRAPQRWPGPCSRCGADLHGQPGNWSHTGGFCYAGGYEQVVLCALCDGELPDEERETLLAGYWLQEIYAFGDVKMRGTA